VTPEYVAQRLLVLEHARGAVYALVTQWLSKHMPLPRTPMHLGTVEAMKSIVASNLGMSIVPDVSVAGPMKDIVVRPLKPEMPCTLALIERRNKPSTPALEIVRNALLELRMDWETEPATRSSSRGAATRKAKATARFRRRTG
jgi:DNA-binding transcriptional LysR family regulator